MATRKTICTCVFNFKKKIIGLFKMMDNRRILYIALRMLSDEQREKPRAFVHH